VLRATCPESLFQSHPAHHNHAMQATLSQQNVAPRQSNDSRELGSLTCTAPPSVSIPSFNCSPHAQAFQPQPNDKHMRRIDEATHQVVQRHLPAPVKTRCDAACNSGIALPVSAFIEGFKIVVETSVGHGHEVFRGCCWHPSFGTGCITACQWIYASAQHSRARIRMLCTVAR